MRCLALFTGGLDSQIAVRLMQRQGIEVIGVYISTPYLNQSSLAILDAAAQLNIQLHQLTWLDNYDELLQRPRFGFATELAPCLDCRIGMIQLAANLLPSHDASFLISGEVVGQRPSSLRSRDLEMMAIHGGLDDLLLRPLSAKLLPPTLPERKGWVDREQLFDWHGRGRKEQFALAREWKLVEAQGHTPGCLLLEPTYAARLKRLRELFPAASTWQSHTLRYGRHFWNRTGAHLVVAKNAVDGGLLKHVLETWKLPECVLMEPLNFRGPISMLFGNNGPDTLRAAAAIVARYSKDTKQSERQLATSGKLVTTVAVPRQDDIDPADQFSALND